MRFRFIFFLLLCGSVAYAQDDGMQAAQMAAAQASQQATQQAMQDMQQASQQAMQNAQQAAQDSTASAGIGMAAKPKLSVKPGTYSSPITLRMKDKTRGAAMYYTTDGWTPTALSTRYVGPIRIASTTHLQAIAIAPYYMRSEIVTASYILPGSNFASAATNSNALGEPGAITATTNLMLPKGAQVPLVVTGDVNSKKLEIGDTIPMALAQDLTVDGVVVAKKGTPALATVTQVDGAGFVGQPGTITFAVHSLNVPGNIIRLDGTETKEGQNKYTTVRSVAVIPFVGMSALFVHGKQAEIAPNTTLTALVDKDTPVHPEE
jgi:hypothetical protein